MSSLGRNIKSLRQSKNWSQEQVASKLGITAPAFSKIESGFTDINYSRLEQISQLFSLSPVELITYHNQEDKKKYQNELMELKDRLAKREAELIELQQMLIEFLSKEKERSILVK